MIKSIWGEEFNIEETPLKNKKLINKLNKKEVVYTEKNLKSKNLPLLERLKIITTNVDKILGQHKENTLIIRDRQTLTNYISKAISNDIIAIDTETNNSLDPITCKLMGPCIYTPGEKQVYIPLHHVNPDTNIELPYQLTEQDIKEEFQRLIDNNTKILMHNGKFDYKVIHCTCGIDLPIYWDTMTAARLLNENEQSAGLKQQYIDKIDPEQEKYSIDHLFENVQYAQVDPEIFALYAATDAKMTYDLYKWQVEAFKDKNLKGVYYIFREIEMPLIIVVAKMELEGISLDLDYANRLSKKYNKLLENCNERLNAELNTLKPKIDLWKTSSDALSKTVSKTGKVAVKSKLEQLEDPINLDSPAQLAILIYDILKSPQVSIKSPRGTGVEELTSLFNKTKLPLYELILEKRTLDKLLNTFIDKLPKDMNPKDNKIHCQFNSLGTDTGRFSSSNPNLQQIPRANIEIKPMFKAPEGHSLVMCDLSGAEVRTACNASQDPDMISAYKQHIYEIEAQNYLDLFSYEIINSSKGNVSIYIIEVGDYIIDEEGTHFKITKKEPIQDKIRIYFEKEVI